MNKNVGQYLKELREKKHLSQNQLANRLHISRSVIAKYETGEREPSFNILIILSKFFKIPITDLIPIYEQNIKSNNTKDVLNYLLKQNKTFRTIVLTLITIIFIIIVSAVIYINILNYVSTKVYKIVSFEDETIIKDGILVTTRDKLYLYLNNSIEEYGVEEIKLYYLDGKDKIYVFSTSEINNLIFYADLNDDEYISFKNYKEFFDNSYLEICYKDKKTDSIKLTYKFDYTNNNLESDVEKITTKEPTTTPSLVEACTSEQNTKSELYDLVMPFIEDYNLETFNIKLNRINYEVFIANKDLNVSFEYKKHKYSLVYSYIDGYEELKLNDITNSTKSLYYKNLTSDVCNGPKCKNVNKDIKLVKKIINEIKK